MYACIACMPVCMYACMYKCMHAFGFMSPFLTSLVITVLFLLHDHLHSVLAHSLVLAHHLAPSRVVQLALDKFLPVSGQRDRPRAHGLVSAAAQSLDDLATKSRLTADEAWNASRISHCLAPSLSALWRSASMSIQCFGAGAGIFLFSPLREQGGLTRR